MGLENVPDFPAWSSEEYHKEIVYKLTEALQHVNIVLYTEAKCRSNLIKCVRLIKQRVELWEKLKSLNADNSDNGVDNDKEFVDVMDQLEKNREKMYKMAECPIQ